MCWSFNQRGQTYLTDLSHDHALSQIFFPGNIGYSHCAHVFLTGGKDTSDPWLAPEKKVQLWCVWVANGYISKHWSCQGINLQNL